MSDVALRTELNHFRAELQNAIRQNEILIGAIGTLGAKINAQAAEIKLLRAQRDAALTAAGEALSGLIHTTRGRRR